MRNLHAARWDSYQSGDSNRPHRTYPLDCKRNCIDDFPHKKVNIYPFGTATSSNFCTLQSPLRVSPPWSTRLWKAGSMTASPMAAGLSSWLFLRWVAPLFTYFLIYACYQEQFQQLYRHICICAVIDICASNILYSSLPGCLHAAFSPSEPKVI